MRILATADLHYEMERGREAVRRLARRMCSRGGDALMILGDTFAGDTATLRECLALFDGFEGAKILCAGNHDLWIRNGGCSTEILEEVLPRAGVEHGFRVLDSGPVLLGDVGFAGGCGWYDYGFRQKALGVPLDFYRLKMGPGVAHRMDPGHDLDLPWEELRPEHYRIGALWNDALHVRWEHTDESFTEQFVARLQRDIESLAPKARRIVCGTHHVPFAEMVVRKEDANWAFGNAFMGSPRIGQALLECPQVACAVFGHSHRPGRAQVGHVEAVNVGSTYTRKRFVEIEV